MTREIGPCIIFGRHAVKSILFRPFDVVVLARCCIRGWLTKSPSTSKTTARATQLAMIGRIDLSATIRLAETRYVSMSLGK
jgi:hypothetical protein